MRDMSKIVKITALVVLAPLITFGLYIIAHGHLTPGGGFQGGVIIASCFALLFMAFGKQSKHMLNKELLSVAESLALFGFVFLALLGLRKSFLNNFLANSGAMFGASIPFGTKEAYINTAGTIPLMNILIGLEVSCALTIIMLLMLNEKVSKHAEK